MNARRRRWLGLALGLVVVLLAAGWFGARGGRAEVKIFFVGFTNTVMASYFSIYSVGSGVTTQEFGMVLVTNSGSVPLRAEVNGQVSGFPDVLKPGESAIGTFFAPPNTILFRHYVGFSRASFRYRLSRMCARLGLSYGAQKLACGPDTNTLMWVSTGWITNTAAVR